MAHNHAHHTPGSARGQRELAITLVLVSLYMVAELIGGWLSNSLALLADAGHMFSDAAALALALFAIWMAQKPATAERTFGYYRAEILAALVNGAALIVIAVFILVEAWGRFRQPPEVNAVLMMSIAAGGLAINLIGLWVLSRRRSDSLNLRGAWLHVLSDALGSLQAVIAGALILWFGWNWVDPIASVLIALLVAYSAWSLLSNSVAVLMEGSPAHIDVAEVRATLCATPRVVDVHDLHIWTITSGLDSLSAHIVIDAEAPDDLLPTLQETLHRRFGIEHVTIQLEQSECGVDEMPI